MSNLHRPKLTHMRPFPQNSRARGDPRPNPLRIMAARGRRIKQERSNSPKTNNINWDFGKLLHPRACVRACAFCTGFFVQKGAKFEKISAARPPRPPQRGPPRARRPRSAQVRHATTAAESRKGPTLQKININSDMYAFYTLRRIKQERSNSPKKIT